MFPDAPLIERHGEVNAMDSPEFRDALAGLNRTQIIVAGIATEACTCPFGSTSPAPRPQLIVDELYSRHYLCGVVYAGGGILRLC